MNLRKLKASDTYQRSDKRYIIEYGSKTIQLTEQELLKFRTELNTFVLRNVIKCSNCGDTGRGKPTLQEPDGEECKECFSSCL